MSYHKFLKTKDRGFIALITSIILSIIIFMIALVSSNSSFWSHLDSGFMVEKEKSFSMATGCLDYAKLKLVENLSYIGNETIFIDNQACEVKTIESGVDYKIIKTTATINNKSTNLSLKINSKTLENISFEEMVSF